MALIKEKNQFKKRKMFLLLYFENYKTTFNFHNLGYHRDKNVVLEEKKI